MKKVLLLTLGCFLSLVVFDAAPPRGIAAGQRRKPAQTPSPTPTPTPPLSIAGAQTAVLVSTEHSMAQCSRIAQQTCDQVFGKCQKFDEGAAGSGPGYLVLYQCHSVNMTVGGVTALVIAGSATDSASADNLPDWMTQSYNTAYRSFK